MIKIIIIEAGIAATLLSQLPRDVITEQLVAAPSTDDATWQYCLPSSYELTGSPPREVTTATHDAQPKCHAAIIFKKRLKSPYLEYG